MTSARLDPLAHICPSLSPYPPLPAIHLQYIPLSVYELQGWIGTPCIYGAPAPGLAPQAANAVPDRPPTALAHCPAAKCPETPAPAVAPSSLICVASYLSCLFHLSCLPSLGPRAFAALTCVASLSRASLTLFACAASSPVKPFSPLVSPFTPVVPPSPL